MIGFRVVGSDWMCLLSLVVFCAAVGFVVCFLSREHTKRHNNEIDTELEFTRKYFEFQKTVNKQMPCKTPRFSTGGDSGVTDPIIKKHVGNEGNILEFPGGSYKESVSKKGK